MTADERTQLASLKTLVENEFGHINDRLDSHSRELAAITNVVHSVDTKLEKHISAEEACEPLKAEDKRSFTNIIVAVLGIAGSIIAGWFAGGHH